MVEKPGKEEKQKSETPRKTGIDIVGNAPWGTHFCQFYKTKKDLTDILVSYFKAGLENNEFCMWVTSEPLKVEDARSSLRKAVKNLDEHIEKGQIEILDYSQWYTKTGKFNADTVLKGWIAKEQEALKKGFDGLRLAENTFRLGKEDWRDFFDFEAKIDSIIGQHRMMALCTYSLDKCGINEVLDVTANHEFTLIKRAGKWGFLQGFNTIHFKEQLKDSAFKWRSTFDAIRDAVSMIDVEGKIVLSNRAMAEFLGRPFQEIIGRTCWELVHGTSKPVPGCPIVTMKETLQRETLTYQIGNKWFEVTADPNFDESGGLKGAIHTISDITERKQMQETLKERVKELNCLYGISSLVEIPDISLDEILKETVMLISPAWQFPDITEACIVLEGQTIQTAGFRETSWMQSREIIVHGKPVGQMVVCYLEEREARNEGPFLKEERYLLNAIAERLAHIIERKRAEEALKKAHDEILIRQEGILNLSEDFMLEIEERKKVEKQLKTSLREKEVLLKEVHHRVKNNMQIISSLLKLGVEHIDVGDAVRIFDESQDRIKAIALIHEKLYQSKDFTKIDFSEYIEDMASELFRVHLYDLKKITLRLDIEPVYFTIELAIPCGLIVNELITNCLKHAFPGDAIGEVAIHLKEKENRDIEIVVSDNGKGIDPSFNFSETKTLGLYIVRILAYDQLKGNFTLDRTKGTTFKITFSREKIALRSEQA